VKYLPLFHHFKAIYQFPKHINCLVKIVANAPLKSEIRDEINKKELYGTNKNSDGFYTKTTQKGFSKLCAKIKRRCYIDLHFSTRKHNLVSFFWLNRILTVELHRSFLYILIFSNSTILEWRTGLSGTILKRIHPRTIPARLGLIWFSGSRGKDLNVILNCVLHLRCLLLLKIEFFSIVHCCFSINQNELKF
jgi:hypothetical protein